MLPTEGTLKKCEVWSVKSEVAGHFVPNFIRFKNVKKQTDTRRNSIKDDIMENTVKFKSKKFAVRIINLYKYLCDKKKEFVLSKQVLKSGTSIGANIAESETAMSRNDFLAKIYIALKECNETLYWLELLYETEYIDKSQFQSLKNDCEEMRRMMSSTTKTMQSKYGEF